MDGNADFLAALKAKTIRSRNDAPLEVISGSNLSLTAMDGTGKVGGQISMNSRQVIFKNKQLNIQNMKVTFLITDSRNSGLGFFPGKTSGISGTESFPGRTLNLSAETFRFKAWTKKAF